MKETSDLSPNNVKGANSKRPLVFGLVALAAVSVLFLYLRNEADRFYVGQGKYRPDDRFLEDYNDTEEANVTKVKLFLGITTAYTEKSAKLRSAIRRTWPYYQTPWSEQTDFRFFMGSPAENHYPLTEEDIQEDDVIISENYMDTYNNLTWKTLQVMKYASENYPDADYFVKVDDDSFLRLNRLVDILIQNNKTHYWGGNRYDSYSPSRSGTWAVSVEEYPSNSGPAWTNGFFYVLGKEAAAVIGNQTKPRIHLEDINTALVLHDYGISPTHIPGIHGGNTCNEAGLVFHYVPPDQVYKYYKGDTTPGLKICDKDIDISEYTSP